MTQRRKRDDRHPTSLVFSIAWLLPDRRSASAHVRAVDVSQHGMRIESELSILAGTELYIQGAGRPGRHALVRHCTAFGEGFRIGLEFADQDGANAAASKADVDYYELLQINPNAEVEAIHRVYRLMAMRYHPDNPKSGDVERFLLLKRAYDVLSDPGRRAQYDAMRNQHNSGPMPVFELKDFVEGVSGEVNRRLGVLCLLYNRRRTDPEHPGISLLDLESRMGIPREYLSFTMWYLRSKCFVTVADNSDYALTAEGADYVERNTSENEPLGKLISGGFWKAPSRPPAETGLRAETPKMIASRADAGSFVV